MSKLIEIRNLCVGYDNKPEVLKNISLDVYSDDFLGIIGQNGGGKTTLLRSILGLIPISSGSITFFDKGRKVDSLNIGYLPQINQIDKKFPISVQDVILLGVTPHGVFKRYSKEDFTKLHKVVKQMGVEDLLQRSIGELSGGQLQRVLLGRAIVDNPKLLVLDEPDSYVDKMFESNIYKLLDEINKERAIILVSHDIGTIISNVKNIACVNQSIHYHSGTNISTQWLQQSYGSCPIELLGHGNLPHRILEEHDHHDNEIHNHS